MEFAIAGIQTPLSRCLFVSARTRKGMLFDYWMAGLCYINKEMKTGRMVILFWFIRLLRVIKSFMLIGQWSKRTP